MIFDENLTYLSNYNKHVVEILKDWEKNRNSDEDQTITVEKSKTGKPTISLKTNGLVRYIISKYDPEREAERFINQLDDIEHYQHILFIGIGFGYHISYFLERFPNKKCSVYEPNIEVLYQYLSHQKLAKWPTERVDILYSGTNKLKLKEMIQYSRQKHPQHTLVATLPFYKQMYEEEAAEIFSSMKETLTNEKMNLLTGFSFQKHWTINAVKNLPYVLETANILNDIDKSYFQGKAALLVAAGPSLAEEMEHIKEIKEKGKAYIFSVGSAVNALIEYGIHPDATFTYDPTELNKKVIQKIIDRKIDDIPLIFGSTCGFETLENYPGRMLHMITSQDLVAPQYLGSDHDIPVVTDAPSIAVIGFQILAMLEFNQIILVGQNLSFLHNTIYSKGINYDFVNNQLSDEQKSALIPTKDVYGREVMTNKEFNLMRSGFEYYISFYKGSEVINTTKGGAHIEGAKFMNLSDVVEQKLSKTQNIEANWLENKNHYDMVYLMERKHKMEDEQNRCEKLIVEAIRSLEDIHKSAQLRQFKHLEKKFAKFDKKFNQLKRNSFYQGYIEAMVRVNNERLALKSQSIRFENDLAKKGMLVVTHFGDFLEECKMCYTFVLPYFKELNEKISMLIENKKE